MLELFHKMGKAATVLVTSLWIEMSAVKGLKSKVINEEDLFACHWLCHLCENWVWRSRWAAEIPDRVIYTENWVSCRQKAAVGRHCGSLGHLLCCLGQKGEVGEMWWWKHTLSLQHKHWGLGEDLMQGRACNGEADLKFVLKDVTLLFNTFKA